MTTRERIIHCFMENLHTEEIRIKFYNWLYAPYHTEEKEKILKSVWDNLTATSNATTLRSLNQVETKLGFNSHKKLPRYIQLKRFARIAALFILPLLSTLLTYIITTREQAPATVNFAECFVPYGEIKKISLPDGTTVTINSGSTLIYPKKNVGNKRYVYLNGEAYFEVDRQEKNPFFVNVSGYNVEVLGTKFNVSAYSDNTHISTTLKEGSVKLNFTDDKLPPFILNPSEQISYNRQTENITLSKVKSEDIAVWRDRHFIFQRASIFDVLKTFERRYGITVYLNSNKYDKDIVTVKFIHGEGLEESFEILKQITPKLQYEIKENKVYVF